MSSTTKNVKNRASQPDPKNFIEKRVEIPEVLKAQQPPPKSVPVEVRKLEKTRPVPIPVVEKVKAIPIPVPEPQKVVIPIPESRRIEAVKTIPEKRIESPKVKIVIKPESSKERVKPPVPDPVLENTDPVDYKTFLKTVEEEVDRNKGMVAAEIVKNGEEFLKEIEARKHVETVKKYKYIPYILKHSKETHTAEELLSYNLNDVKAIYLDIKEAKRSQSLFVKIGRFFKFLFNIQ
jgi:hypothetical protein